MGRPQRLTAAGAVGLLVLAVAVAAAPASHGRSGSSPFVLATPGPIPIPSASSASPEPGPSPTTTDVSGSVAMAAGVEPLPPVEAIAELRAGGEVAIDAGAHVRSVSTAAGDPLPAVPGGPDTTDPVAVAAGFVNRYGQGLGLLDGEHVAVARVDGMPGGDRLVRLHQQVGGVPVLGGDIVVAVTAEGRVSSMSAETAPDAPATGTAAAVSAERAGALAVEEAAKRLGVAADRLVTTSVNAWMFDPRTINAPGRAELRLTWWVKVADSGRGHDLESVFVDATDGAVVLAFSELETARNRVICDLANASGLDIENDFTTYDCSDAPGGPPVVRREGQGPVGVADVNAAYDNLGAVYDFYKNNFGRDSIDGVGLPMVATVRACEMSCPYSNAFWDGVQMVFGPGFAGADDVVGHELTHGVTERTSNLVYYSESGGINEAISDIMGEFLDQSEGTDNDSQWLLGEDLPIGAVRSMSSPPSFGQPERVNDANWNAHYTDSRDNYGVHYLSGVVNKAAYLLAVGGSLGGVTVSGIGRDKSQQIWYRLEYMLPSGADMLDISQLLPAACRSIIGLHGITSNDCVQARQATLATAMDQPAGLADQPLCAQPGMPSHIVFSDDFERGFNQWSLPSIAEGLPSAQFPVTWANSGSHSVDTFVPPFTTNAQRMLLRNEIRLPEHYGELYISWSENIFTETGGGNVYLTLNGFVANTYTGANGRTLGYVRQTRATGHNFGSDVTVGLQFLPGNALSGGNEWMLDDVMIYECMPNVNGAPGWVTGELTGGGTSATLNWAAPDYLAPGNAPVSYEIGLLPARSPGDQPIIVPAGQLSYTLTGLDPQVRYLVTVRAIGADGVPGPGVGAYLPTDPLYACSVGATNGVRRNCQSTPPLAPLPR